MLQCCEFLKLAVLPGNVIFKVLRECWQYSEANNTGMQKWSSIVQYTYQCLKLEIYFFFSYFYTIICNAYHINGFLYSIKCTVKLIHILCNNAFYHIMYFYHTTDLVNKWHLKFIFTRFYFGTWSVNFSFTIGQIRNQVN